MSHDPQSPSDAADHQPDEPDAVCGECGAFMDATEISVEAFEKTGKVLCEECAEEALEDDDNECCPGCGACPGFTGVECDETCEWATTGGGAA